ncbi:MAG: BMP family protein [Streptococcaceae bacterium]|jgi:basic membrane protein A|nr:BMP family protein [Streptococcaceae bacterium]
MNIKKVAGLAVVALASVSVLAACRSNSTGSSSKTDLKVAIITDTGGVNDHSFNQSAWEGLQAWGKDNGLSKGKGFNYFQSNSASDYTTNFQSALDGGYKLMFGIGFSLQSATQEAAKNNPSNNFVIIDSVIDGQKNVASAVFGDNEAAYLAGVAAAKTTKTKHIGFIGGGDKGNAVILAFETGFKAGVASIDKSIKVDVQYAGSFTDAGIGKTIANTMYASGADVVYQCAGGVGDGAFQAAKALNETKNEADKVWLIGVDRDQESYGAYTSKDGKSANFTLVSTVKKVGKVVQDISDQTKDGKFPGGKTETYNLKNGGVDLAKDNATDSTWSAVQTAKQAIIDGKVTVASK